MESLQLPTAGVADHFGDFFVAKNHGRLAGAIGLERYGTLGLLRSAAVAPGLQKSGIGSKLTRLLIDFARAEGLTELVLFTPTAEAFFARFGFVSANRENYRAPLKASAQWGDCSCRASAEFMRLGLQPDASWSGTPGCFVYKETTVNRRSQKEKANLLLSLHMSGGLLVLPNVWNPIGARILEKKGYPAVATASAAISASLGYQDGEKIKRATVVDLTGRIARSVEVPVTADIETGYGESLSELEETAQEVLESGVVGVNIEDGLEWSGALRTIDDQCQRIATLRQYAERRGMHLVINARTDSFVSSSFTNKEEAAEEAVTRAKAFCEAGADCFYPIGPGDEATVRLLRDRIKSPINILVSPTAAPLDIMRDIGVNRVSFGPYIFRSCTRRFADIVDVLRATGDYSCFADMMSRAEVGEYLLPGHE